MKIQKENRCRVLSSNDYSLFKHNAKRISKARLNLLIEEMQIKNLSKDLPIIVDDNFNILDGKYRFEANKLLKEKVYYKCAEVGNYIDFMKAADLQYKPTIKDFAIHHSDKLSYRKILEYANKLPFGFKEFMHEICDLSTRSRPDMRKFKDGLFDFTIQQEYKAKEAVKIVDYIYKEISDQIIITDIGEILDASQYSLKRFIEIINKDRSVIIKYVELLEDGYPLDSVYADEAKHRDSDITFFGLFVDIDCIEYHHDGEIVDNWQELYIEERMDEWRGRPLKIHGYNAFPIAKKICEVYDLVYDPIAV